MKKRRKVINKKITILLFFGLIFGVVYYIDFRGFVTMPPIVLKVINVVFTITIATLMKNILLRYTEHRIFDFLKDEIELEQRIFLTKLYKGFLNFIVITVILFKLGLTLPNITLFIGLMATGLAFAVRDFLMSYLVWMIILIKNPFRIGDCVKIEDSLGEIMRIGTFFITLKLNPSPDDQSFIKVPNNKLFQFMIINYGKGKVCEKVVFPVQDYELDYDSKLSEIRESVKEIVSEEEIVFIGINYLDEKLSVVVEYNCPFTERHHTRNGVYIKLLDLFSKDKDSEI